MRRLLIVLGSLGLPLALAMAAGLSLSALLATLGIGLLTSLCLVPAVLVSELISRWSGAPRSGENGTAV